MLAVSHTAPQLPAAMPRYTVHVRSEWLTVPCKDTCSTVLWLGREALRRYVKNKPDNGGLDCVADVTFLMRRCQGQGLLDPDDAIEDVLEDNDFVEVVITGDDSRATEFNSLSTQRAFLKYREPQEYIELDGKTLTTENLVKLGKGLYKIQLTPEAVTGVKKSRDLVEKIINENKAVYGITTGFGKFARIVIPNNKLEELQENVILASAVGVGKPLSQERSRMLLALRINALSKGHSGISSETLHQMIQAFNASCLSYVPEKGTVGASGDLAPLSHLALGLMGKGKMWSPKCGWADAEDVLRAHSLKPISPKAKEGLSLINGTQMITSLGAEAVERATAIARQADIIAALTLEVLKGSTRAFDSDIHSSRPHPGQAEVASRFRSLLDSDIHSSEIADSHRFCDRVQDPFTICCCSQVHGVVNETIAFVKKIILTEINSATDNPIVFAERGEIISGGNFHGEYPAKALDYLAIGVHELAAISERRIERLCNPSLSGLPAFLVTDGGLNCGFMVIHCTAAALVSENKVLCHPSSVDSLSTSAATEDHVSMGGWAARKALRVIEHVEQVLAIELLAACQALEFLRPLHTTAPLETVYQLVRSVVKALDKDRSMAPDIETAQRLLTEEKVWQAVQPYMEHYRNVKTSE
ncbi:histidine ammonia-lyase-like [Callorhinchus milii]|uniref:histidine ammonia-lyase-like n=1 Tax=Callorhinchus milii TaxID=7868 RepID=UPI0004572AA7|nr:histidine ammonia-lyase-like [Callorhinchus milii]XP_042201540.1 histidine ammonia-lyase-like [Callorhinchus milii]|eukprot:gi/632980830/ref/XP_007907254.1/ PREDICTED: histidine ammonia-lyase-like [Callorhinchus milii]